MIVRHGDLGPWNTVWRGADLVGVIDWDLAEPGHAIDDIAQIAWSAVPLRHDDPADLDPVLHFRHLCRICAADPAAVIAALLRLQAEEIRRTLTWGGAGRHPWTVFLAHGDVERHRADIRWLEARARSIAVMTTAHPTVSIRGPIHERISHHPTTGAR